MCHINNTAETTLFWTTLLKEDEYGSNSSSDNSEATSVLLTYVRAILLSSALPGLLTLLSWLLWLMYYASFRSNASQLPLPPGSMGLPLIGETINFFLMGATFYKKRRKLYGDVFKTHLMGSPVVRVVGAKNVRKVLLGENTLVSSFWPASVRLMLGSNTIAMTTGTKHKFLRKGVMKAFNHDALSSYTAVMQQMTRDAIQRWCDAAYVRGYRECQTLTFSIACHLLLGLGHTTSGHSGCFGQRAESEKLLDVFQTWSNNLFSLPINLPGCGLSRGLRARKVLLDKIEECIRAKEREENATSPRTDALSLMMHLGGEQDKLSMEELKEVLLELLFAGYTTVASVSTSLLYFLGRNPRVVKKIQRELEDHGLKDGSQGEDLTLDTLSRLTYTGHVIKEVLRLAPPIGGGFRKALKTFELDGYQVPKDWMVVYSIRETQTFSELFSDADSFDPERWEAIAQQDEKEDFHFLPFSRGARGCVGKEYAKLLLKIMTVEMCRGCQWRLLNEDAELEMMPVPHPADGLALHVTHLLPAHVRPRAATV